MPGTNFGPWIDSEFDYEISREAMHISVDGMPICSTPLARFEVGMRKARRVIDAHYAKKAEVVPIRGRKRGHAATS